MKRQERITWRLRYKQRVKTHTAHFPHMQAVIQFAPSRESTTPFCAYFGPHGETCSNTTDLETVFTLPCIPPYQFMACSLHREVVAQRAQTFLASLEQQSKRV